VADPGGAVKHRPVVIITPTDEMVLDAPIFGVAVTTSYPDPPGHEYVELPWYRHGHPATGLTRRSAAACRWVVELRPSQIVETKGFVPTKILLEIVRRVRELNEPEN